MGSKGCMIIVSVLKDIIWDIVNAAYPSLFVAVFLAYMTMYFFMFANCTELSGQGCKYTLRIWLRLFVKQVFFRKTFILLCYVYLILCKTIFMRSIFPNPLCGPLGGWWISRFDILRNEIVYNKEAFENILMFIPFSVFYSDWKRPLNIFKYKSTIVYLPTVIISALFSLIIVKGDIGCQARETTMPFS